LSKLTGLSFPSAEEEARDPQGADAVYTAAVTALRERQALKFSHPGIEHTGLLRSKPMNVTTPSCRASSCGDIDERHRGDETEAQIPT
jgi:hypothetical protein